MQNEELIREFDSFRQKLKERDPPSWERNHYEGNAGYATESKTVGEKIIRRGADRTAGFTPFPTTEKLSLGETIRLNETDTTQWKKTPRYR